MPEMPYTLPLVSAYVGWGLVAGRLHFCNTWHLFYSQEGSHIVMLRFGMRFPSFSSCVTMWRHSRLSSTRLLRSILAALIRMKDRARDCKSDYLMAAKFDNYLA